MKLLAAIFVALPSGVISQTWHRQDASSEFLIGPSVNSYEEADMACGPRNAYVARVKTKATFDFLVGKIGTLPGPPYSFYIGAKRIHGSSKFRWTDGSNIVNGQWDPTAGEPKAVGNKLCVIMGDITEIDPTYRWISANCSVSSRYICQRNAPTSSSSTTSSQPTTTLQSTTTSSTTSKPTPPTKSPLLSSTGLIFTSPNSVTSSSTSTASGHSVPTTKGVGSSLGSNSQSTIIGAAVGVGVVLIIAGIALVFLVIRKRRSGNERSDPIGGRDGEFVATGNEAPPETAIYATAKPRKNRKNPTEESEYEVAQNVNDEDIGGLYAQVNKPTPTEEEYVTMQCIQQDEDAYDHLQHSSTREQPYNQEASGQVGDVQSSNDCNASTDGDDTTYAVVRKSRR